MTRQLKFILILVVLAVVLLIGGGIIAYFYWQNNGETTAVNVNNSVTETNTNNQTTNSTVKTNQNTNGTTTTPVDTPEIKELTDTQMLDQLAKSFTERYGSFSNQNDYENLLNLKIYMTKRMQEEVDEFVEESAQDDVEVEDYYGITTKILTIKQVSLEGSKAMYQITAQRNEAQGLTGANKTYTQGANIEFKKADAQWKVHKFTWN